MRQKLRTSVSTEGTQDLDELLETGHVSDSNRAPPGRYLLKTEQRMRALDEHQHKVADAVVGAPSRSLR